MASEMVKDENYRRNRPSPTAEDWALTAKLSTMTAEEKANYIEDDGAEAYDKLFPPDLSDDSSKSGIESDNSEDELQNRKTLSGPAHQKLQLVSEHGGSQTSSTRLDKPGKEGRLSRQQTRRANSRRKGASRSPMDNDRSGSHSVSRGGPDMSSRSSSSSADTRPTTTGPALTPASDSITVAGNYVEAKESSLSVSQFCVGKEMKRMVNAFFYGQKTSEPSPSKPPPGSNTASSCQILLPKESLAYTNDNSTTTGEHARSEKYQESGTTAEEKLTCTQLEKMMHENRVKWKASWRNISRLKDGLRQLDQDFDELERTWVTQNQTERDVENLGANFGHLTKYITETNKRMLMMNVLTDKAKNKVLVPDDVHAALKIFSVNLKEVGMKLSLIKSSESQSTSAKPLTNPPASLLLPPPSFKPVFQSAVALAQSAAHPGSLSDVLSAAILPGFSPAVFSAAALIGSRPDVKKAASPLATFAVSSPSVLLASPLDGGKFTDTGSLQDIAKRPSSCPVGAGESIEAQDTSKTSGRFSSASSHKKHKEKHSHRRRTRKHMSKSKHHHPEKVEDTSKGDAEGVLSGSCSTGKDFTRRHRDPRAIENKTVGSRDP